MASISLVPLGLGAFARMGTDDPEEARIRTQALDVHLAVRSGRQVDQSIQGEMLMVSKAAVVEAPEAFDARGLVTGEKQAVSDPRDGGEILVERVLQMPERPPIGEGEGNLGDGLSEAGIRHEGSWCAGSGTVTHELAQQTRQSVPRAHRDGTPE